MKIHENLVRHEAAYKSPTNGLFKPVLLTSGIRKSEI